MKKLALLLLTILLSTSLFAASSSTLDVSTVIEDINTLEFRLNGNKVESAVFSNGKIENLTVVLNSNQATGALPKVTLSTTAMTNGTSTINFAASGVNTSNIFENVTANTSKSTSYTSSAITLTQNATDALNAVAGTYTGSVTVQITSAT